MTDIEEDPLDDDLHLIDLTATPTNLADLDEIGLDDVDEAGDEDSDIDEPAGEHPASEPVRPGSRPAILPGWLASWADARAAARWWVDDLWFRFRYHLARLPAYGWRLFWRWPYGLGRLGRTVGAWVIDVEGAEDRRAAREVARASERAASEIRHAREAHARAIAGHLLVVIAMVVLVVLVGIPVFARLDVIDQVVTVVAVGLMLGLNGRSPDRPIVEAAYSPERPVRLTPEAILAALSSLGIPSLRDCDTDDGPQVEILQPGVHRDGPGWRVEMNLPPGVTAAEVVKKRSALASAIRRPVATVWPEIDKTTHEGRLIIYVADRSPGEVGGEWPLLVRGKVDLFEPFPIGVNPRGEPVYVTLMGKSLLTGGVPGAGKTNAERLFGLGAALDPRAELIIADFKGGADWADLEPIAHWFRAPAGTQTEVEEVIVKLEELADRMDRRYTALGELPPELVPDKKITGRLAGSKRHDFHPIVVLVDEVQDLFARTLPKDLRKRSEAAVTRLAKKGRAVGVIVVLATQRPDKDSVPTGVRDNLQLRLCLYVTTADMARMILGDGMTKAGFDATALDPDEPGVAVFRGGGPTTIVKTHYIDGRGSEAVIKRAYAARAAAGRLPTPDDEDTEPVTSVLDDIVAIWPPAVRAIHLDMLAELLAGAHGGRYDGWDGPTLGKAVRSAGCPTRKLKAVRPDSGGVTARTPRAGVRLDDLLATLDQADTGGGDRPDNDSANDGVGPIPLGPIGPVGPNSRGGEALTGGVEEVA